ncbi:hypothetical protein SLEP1_g21775 [Rubroshorea leprosula]|uniref:Uncharacterized protein n=1 Tax=Rubroshorea leprosula TaxID=152421 RepID=A0AAV5JHW0_9ROSI|nr:hypothetical protein SLEP1_g21775 [Rubroshorea leprosula]
MSHKEVEYSEVNVPFSWELKPGVSKAKNQEGSIDVLRFTLNLPPPPCASQSARFNSCEFQKSLPPCIPHPPLSTRGSLKKSTTRKQDDPFVAAYRKCTECSINGKNEANSRTKKKNIRHMSCKYSCSVSSDNVVRIAQFPRLILKEIRRKEEQKHKENRK